jgi:hypothetical protein
MTGKPSRGRGYAAAAAHCETVLRGFYDLHLEAGTGPMVNPFPVMQTNSQSPEDSGPITGSYGHRKPISQLPRQPRGIGVLISYQNSGKGRTMIAGGVERA